jgi:hypothetical protein
MHSCRAATSSQKNKYKYQLSDAADMLMENLLAMQNMPLLVAACTTYFRAQQFS